MTTLHARACVSLALLCVSRAAAIERDVSAVADSEIVLSQAAEPAAVAPAALPADLSTADATAGAVTTAVQQAGAIRVFAGIGLMDGDTTYRIGGHVETPDGDLELPFPISELEFPMHVLMGRVGIAIDLGSSFRVDASVCRNLTTDAGVMKDSDYGVAYMYGVPGFGRDSLDIYSESDAELDAALVEAAVHYRLIAAASLRLDVGVGYRSETFDYTISNLDQWYPSARPSGSLHGVHEYEPGRVATYEVEYRMVFMELSGRCRIQRNLDLEGRLAVAPAAEAEDADHHILRAKRSETEADGSAIMLGASARYGLPDGLPALTRDLFLLCAVDFRHVETEGRQRQWMAGDPLAVVDAEIESDQLQFTVSLGKTF